MRSAETYLEPESGEELEKILIDLPPDRPLEPLLDFLAIEEEPGRLAWETGWL